MLVPLWLAVVVAAARLAARVERRNAGAVLPTVLAAEAALLGLFLVVGVALVPHPDASTLLTQTVVAGAGVCAMATQSVVSRLAGYAYPTTMVTGTLTLLGMDLRGDRALALGRAVMAFAGGALLGGAVT